VTAVAPNIELVLASRLIAGLGAAMFSPTATATGASLVPPEQRGRALAIVIGGLSSATALGAPLGTFIGGALDWRATMWFVAAVGTGFGTDKLEALAQAGAFDATDDRAYLLSQAPRWDEGVAKLKVKMSCGHLKSKTIKLTDTSRQEFKLDHPTFKGTDVGRLAVMTDDWLEDLHCPHHPDAFPEKINRLDDTCSVARWLKEHDGEPRVVKQPTPIELNDMELNALHVSLTQSKFLQRYKPFLDKRIYTENEINNLPKHPKRNGHQHGNWCTCERCKLSACVIGGEITATKVILTKAKDKMAFLDIAYEANQYSCTLFPKTYSQYEELLTTSALFLIAGYKDDRNQIVVTDMADVFEVAADQEWEIEDAR